MTKGKEPRTELAGPGQGLHCGGVLAAAAGSLVKAGPCSDADRAWLRAFLTNVLSAAPGLDLRAGAVRALVQQALEVADAKNPVVAALEVADSYLSAAEFSVGQAVPVVASVLHADVFHVAAYDARSREALMRFVGALDLPPRILFDAEKQLVAIVHTLSKAAAEGNDGRADGGDAEEERRRRMMRWLKIGGAGVIGGIALGISGGLMAPALLPALGSVGLAGVSAPLVAMGGTSAVAVGGIFGVAGASVGATAMRNRTGDVEEFTFESCTVLDDGKNRASVYEHGRVTPARKCLEVVVPISSDEPIVGGLLAWEFVTSQTRPMVVPAGLGFGVVHQRFSDADGVPQKREWILPEKVMDAGGLEPNGSSKHRRSTGAITVMGSGLYTLLFRLLPGSLSTSIKYRVALVPPGKDPPLWLMHENEVEGKAGSGSGDEARHRSMSMTLFVPGLVNTEEGVPPYPGVCADQFSSAVAELGKYDIQAYALRWDVRLLSELSINLKKLVASLAMKLGMQQGAMLVAPMLVGAFALPVTIAGALRTIISNTWATTLSHAQSCGYMLAVELASRGLGKRPVVLCGYSAGALVIFAALEELARRKCVGIVHDVYLLAAPCSTDPGKWRSIRQVVSGRLVNAYTCTDWYLEAFHRGAGFGSAAGTGPIRDIDAGVENVDLSDFEIQSHMDFATRSSEILLALGLIDGDKRRPWSTEQVSRSKESAGGVVDDSPPPGCFSRSLKHPDDVNDGAEDDEGDEDDDDDEIIEVYNRKSKRLSMPRFLRAKSSKI